MLAKNNLIILQENLPNRFYNKIIHDLDFIIGLEIPFLKEIYLFGSCARFEQKYDSDVDLAIITEKPLKDHYLRGMILDCLDYELEEVSTDVIFRSSDSDGYSNLFNKEFERDKMLLWKKN